MGSRQARLLYGLVGEYALGDLPCDDWRSFWISWGGLPMPVTAIRCFAWTCPGARPCLGDEAGRLLLRDSVQRLPIPRTAGSAHEDILLPASHGTGESRMIPSAGLGDPQRAEPGAAFCSP